MEFCWRQSTERRFSLKYKKLVIFFYLNFTDLHTHCQKLGISSENKVVQKLNILLQLNKYETDTYFLQIFQRNASFYLIILVFCKSCEPIHEPICEPEITHVLYHFENQNKQFLVQSLFSVQLTNLTVCLNKHFRALENLKKKWICLTSI